VQQEQLPDEALVVRGGQLDRERLRARAARDRRPDGVYVLSVWCGVKDAEDEDEVVLRRLVQEAPIPHGQLNVTTAERLRTAGFEVSPSPPPACHYDLELGTVVDSATIDRVVQAFDTVRSNIWRRNG
jgi:hypothetical protein